MSLLQEIQNDPLALGYSTYTVEAPGRVADIAYSARYVSIAKRENTANITNNSRTLII